MTARRRNGEKAREARELAEEVVIAERDGRLAQAQAYRAQLERLVGGRANAYYHVETARESLGA